MKFIIINLFIKLCPLKFMSDAKRRSTKVGEKLQLSDLAIFLIFLFDIPLHFHNSILVGPLKYLMHFLAGINIK